MTFAIVEIDNQIGRVTSKDEGGGVLSLDINVRSGEVTIKSPANRNTFIETQLGQVEFSVTEADFTTFYSFTPTTSVFFKEAIVIYDSDHIIQFAVDGQAVFEESIKALKDTDVLKVIYPVSDYFRFLENPKVMSVSLNSFYGGNITIAHKRRPGSGTGNIRTQGLIVTYEEEAI